MFWVMLAIWVGIAALQTLFRPRAPRRPNVTPELWQTITAEEGRPIPVVWGKRKVDNANLTWYRALAPAPLVDHGAIVAYKYFMDAMYVICLGPIDNLDELRFNNKVVGAGINATNNQLVIGVGATKTIATIPIGNYSNGAALATAIENAMKLAIPGDWKTVFGYHVVSGVNDEIAVSLTINGETAEIRGRVNQGAYLGSDLGAQIAATLSSHFSHVSGPLPLGNFTVSWVPTIVSGFVVGGTFAITYHSDIAETVTGMSVHTFAPVVNYARTLNTTIGVPIGGADLTGSGAKPSVTAPTLVSANRFNIAFAGTGGTVFLSDPASTAAAALGFATSGDVSVGIAVASNDFTVVTGIFTPTADGLQIYVDDPTFFDADGGLQGFIDIYYGGLAQSPSAYLATAWGTTVPAYRGICYAIVRGMYVGNRAIPPQISFTVARCPNLLGLPDTTSVIIGDANPAAMAYELITDPRTLIGLPPAALDVSAFLACGDTLATEGIGLSLIVDAISTGEEIIKEILRHIDGILYVDQVTGLIAMKLARPDYVVADLPGLTVDVAETIKLTRSSWDETRNVIRLRYIDRALGYTERIVQVMDLANAQARGGDLSIEEIMFPGLSNRTNARTVALRALKALSHPLAQLEIKVDRTAWRLRPGDPFRLTCSHLGITDLPCRVTRVHGGDIASGQITVDAVEDAVGPAWTGFVAPVEPAPDPEEV
jgi:hypothetical protein